VSRQSCKHGGALRPVPLLPRSPGTLVQCNGGANQRAERRRAGSASSAVRSPKTPTTGPNGMIEKAARPGLPPEVRGEVAAIAMSAQQTRESICMRSLREPNGLRVAR
jgi:hypothetical protein